MRAMWLQPDEAYLDQRRRWGADQWDEVWDGVLHIVPLPGFGHQHFKGLLLTALTPVVEQFGLIARSGACSRRTRTTALAI
jgi:hypothetical protein